MKYTEPKNVVIALHFEIQKRIKKRLKFKDQVRLKVNKTKHM